MRVKEVLSKLEEWAPLPLQESYDNSGLIVGDAEVEVTGILVALDCTEAVIDDAIAQNCNLIVSHHPIVFKGLKRLTGSNYVERTVIKALKNNIALYAIHTNLDNVQTGVNQRIADRLNLVNRKILAPKTAHLRKLVVFCPHQQVDAVRSAMFDAGAGSIGDYDECSFNLKGEGTFRGLEDSNAFVGEQGKRHTEPETRIEVLYAAHQEGTILTAMKTAHPYEEVAHDIYSLENTDNTVGAGMVGELEQEMDEMAFLLKLKKQMNTDCVRYTPFRGQPVKRVALCGGSGSFLLNRAKSSGADVFITGDFKYHDFFDADEQIVIADIGHYESEQFTIDLLIEYLANQFTNMSISATRVNTNPIHYL